MRTDAASPAHASTSTAPSCHVSPPCVCQNERNTRAVRSCRACNRRARCRSDRACRAWCQTLVATPRSHLDVHRLAFFSLPCLQIRPVLLPVPLPALLLGSSLPVVAALGGAIRFSPGAPKRLFKGLGSAEELVFVVGAVGSIHAGQVGVAQSVIGAAAGGVFEALCGMMRPVNIDAHCTYFVGLVEVVELLLGSLATLWVAAGCAASAFWRVNDPLTCRGGA